MAIVSTEEVATVAELLELVPHYAGAPKEFSIAVEGLVFDIDGRWILIERGGSANDEVGKLEGIGGRAEGLGELRAELCRELREEAGDEAKIDIVSFFEIKSDTVQHKGVEKNWIIASFLCRHVSGALQVTEPHKNRGFVYISNLDIEADRLSSSCKQSLNSLHRRWSWVKEQLDLS
jgi:hypothetical protein